LSDHLLTLLPPLSGPVWPIDFENGDRWTHTINLGVAKRLSNIPVTLSATLEKQLDGGNKKFQANLTITYYFERFHLPK
jgi:hypothetical protein